LDWLLLPPLSTTNSTLRLAEVCPCRFVLCDSSRTFVVVDQLKNSFYRRLFVCACIVDTSRRKRKRHRRQNAIASLRRQSAQQLRLLLDSTCGVVSGYECIVYSVTVTCMRARTILKRYSRFHCVDSNTGKMCTKSLRCPQHSESQRINVRRLLLDDPNSVVNLSTPPPSSVVKSSDTSVDVFVGSESLPPPPQ
jgi:hypothetical protein